MKELLIGIIWTLSLLSVHSKPTPCVVPGLLEGTQMVFDEAKGTNVIGRFSYDAFGEKFRVVETAWPQVTDSDPQSVELLFLFREATGYLVYLNNNTCMKFPLSFPFHKLEVPPNSTFLSQVFVGGSSLPNQGLLVNVWGGVCPKTKDYVMTTMTAFGCLPISITIVKQGKGFITNTYMDLTLGIQDPNVFFPPPQCP